MPHGLSMAHILFATPTTNRSAQGNPATTVSISSGHGSLPHSYCSHMKQISSDFPIDLLSLVNLETTGINEQLVHPHGTLHQIGETECLLKGQ
jgi:hypothetical protein